MHNSIPNSIVITANYFNIYLRYGWIFSNTQVVPRENSCITTGWEILILLIVMKHSSFLCLYQMTPCKWPCRKQVVKLHILAPRTQKTHKMQSRQIQWGSPSSPTYYYALICAAVEGLKPWLILNSQISRSFQLLAGLQKKHHVSLAALADSVDPSILFGVYFVSALCSLLLYGMDFYFQHTHSMWK